MAYFTSHSWILWIAYDALALLFYSFTLNLSLSLFLPLSLSTSHSLSISLYQLGRIHWIWWWQWDYSDDDLETFVHSVHNAFSISSFCSCVRLPFPFLCCSIVNVPFIVYSVFVISSQNDLFSFVFFNCGKRTLWMDVWFFVSHKFESNQIHFNGTANNNNNKMLCYFPDASAGLFIFCAFTSMHSNISILSPFNQRFFVYGFYLDGQVHFVFNWSLRWFSLTENDENK